MHNDIVFVCIYFTEWLHRRLNKQNPPISANNFHVCLLVSFFFIFAGFVRRSFCFHICNGYLTQQVKRSGRSHCLDEWRFIMLSGCRTWLFESSNSLTATFLISIPKPYQAHPYPPSPSTSASNTFVPLERNHPPHFLCAHYTTTIIFYNYKIVFQNIIRFRLISWHFIHMYTCYN